MRPPAAQGAAGVGACPPPARPDVAPRIRDAVLLGLAQGPTELLPVSSSAHTELLARCGRLPFARASAEQRKSFEIALHAGAGLALALALWPELRHGSGRVGVEQAGPVALALLPPALAGYLLERPIERHLGGPRSIAAGLAGGGLALGWAEARARRADRPGRALAAIGPRDGLVLGLSQALALMPGVSRNGATLTAALARGFDRPAADALSWHTGLPVMLGACALRAARLRRRGVSAGERRALVAGAASAFLSTLASARVLDQRARAERSLVPLSLYRCALAAAVLARAGDRHTPNPAPPK